jgi:heterodisulfide reductase subunit A-like polyferredoxin
MKLNYPFSISISVEISSQATVNHNLLKSNQLKTMSSAKVLIIGCGVAGPVIALLLQKKGYEPIVFEKVRELGDAGASLMMFPNG